MSAAVTFACRECGAPTPFRDERCARCRSAAGEGLPYVQPTQLALPGLGPSAGDRYRNKGTGRIVTVLGVEQRKQAWVRIRAAGTEQSVTLLALDRHFDRI